MANNIFSLNTKPGKGVTLFGKGPSFKIKPIKPFGINTQPFGSAKNISKIKKLKRPRDIDIFPIRLPKKPKRDKDLNWTQASTRYRHLSPFADTDKDGIQNWQDCRPLNINMQGPLHPVKPYKAPKRPQEKDFKWKPFKGKDIEEPTDPYIKKGATKEEKSAAKEKHRKEMLKYHKKQAKEEKRRTAHFDTQESKRIAHEDKESDKEAKYREKKGEAERKWAEEEGPGGKGRRKKLFKKDIKTSAIAKTIFKDTSPTRAKEKARAEKRLGLGTLGFLGLISGQEQRSFTPAYRGGASGASKGTGSGARGRPTGSYKYSIPGKGPVHVYEYRKWARRQRALKRLQREPEYEEFEGERIQQGEFEPQPEQQRPQERFTEGRGQYEAIQQDRGEMRAGETIERGKSSILSAPNLFNEEERRNLAPMRDPVQHVDTIHKPVVNPEGDYYTDVDPLSGKPILQRRVRERWAEGE